MATRTLEKFVAVSLLEASKSALDHMGRWRMELSHRGEEPSNHLTSTYGSLRRVRDYIQSCLYAGGRDVSWEMSPEDENLLVSCIAHYLRELEATAASGQTRGAAALRLKQDDLVKIAVEMATREVVDLPAPKAGGMQARAAQDLRKRVVKKLRGPVGDKLIAWGAPGGGDVSISPSPSVEDLMPDPASPQSAVAADRPKPEAQPLLDVRTMRDPHLRALTALDQGAFGRALKVRDHRLATVHLFSIMEAAMLDYVLARRRELGLPGGPDSWNLKTLVLKLLGEETPEWEHRAVETICAASHLISPLKQHAQPIVVTPSNLDLQTDVVKKVLVKLGYKGTAVRETAPADPAE